MNKETLDLLQQLAAKLGTTAEHLWAVLIKQAFISACTDFLFYVITVALLWFAIKKTPKWAQIISNTDSDFIEIGGTAAVVVGWVLVGGLVIAALICIPDTIAALANPEYWALKQILNAVGGKSSSN